MIGNLYVLKGHNCHKKYPTQLTVTLQNCRKIWSSIFVTFLVFFALFFANSFTVMVALVAKPLVLPSQWTLLQKIVQKTLEMWLKLLQTFLQFSNVTVSSVKYQKDSLIWARFLGPITLDDSWLVQIWLAQWFLWTQICCVNQGLPVVLTWLSFWMGSVKFPQILPSES